VHIGVDEKSFMRGHSYITVVSDIDRSRVIEVGHGRDEAAVTDILDAMTDVQKEGIQAAAVDMWGPYLNAVTKALPDADIVHDKFHVVKHLGEAVDKVRKVENKVLNKAGISDLKGTKYLWLTHPSHWTERKRDVPGTQRQAVEGRKGMVDQRNFFLPVGLRLSQTGEELLQTMVLLGNPFAS